MVIHNKFVPEGEGYEVDYDNYCKKNRKRFLNANEWWTAFASNGLDEWEKCKFKGELLNALGNDKLLAIVVYHFIGRQYKEWMVKRDYDDLGGLTPEECLETIWGNKRLRMLFLKWP